MPLLSTTDSSCWETIDGDMAAANNFSIYSTDGSGGQTYAAAAIVEMFTNYSQAADGIDAGQ